MQSAFTENMMCRQFQELWWTFVKWTPKGLKKIHELYEEHGQRVQIKIKSEDRCQKMGRRRRPKENK